MAEESSLESENHPGRLPIGHVVPTCFGMCFTLIFNMALFASASDISLPLMNLQTLARVASIIAFVSVTWLSRSGFSLVARPGALWCSAIATAVGAMLLYSSPALGGIVGPDATSALALVGVLLCVGGYSVTFLAWLEMLAGMSMDYAVLYYIGARLLSAGMRSTFSILPDEMIEASMMVMPFLSTLCLQHGRASSKDVPYAQGELIYPRWRVPWRPIALLTTFEFVLNLVTGVSGSGISVSIIGSLLGCAFVLGIVLLRFKRFDLKATHYLALPLLLASMMCVMLGGGFSTPGAALGFAAHDVFLAFVFALLFDISFRRGVNPLWVFGLTQAFVTGGILASYVLRERAVMGGFVDVAIAVSVVGVTVAFMVFLTDRDYSNAWGIRIAGEPDGDDPVIENEPDDDQRLEQRCAVVARQYDLTRREEEVLLMRLRGSTHRDLEEQLVISNNTVKSHIRHIYRKMGVTDLDEARELVERA